MDEPKPIHLGGKWPKGVSGNPGGRPKTKPFREALAKIIEQLGGPDEAAKAIYARALTGDVAAFRECADRLDGKVPQAIANSEDGPFKLEVTWKKSLSTTSQDPSSSPSTTEPSASPASSPTEEPGKP